jgi:serine/threonine protein kinase/Flp pilus assembly protein TadD
VTESGPYQTAQISRVFAAVRDVAHPTQIGPYTILSLIGEGGMGSVYKAEQRTPIHRIVAVKVIKVGMDTHEVIARFESERQALAMMDHPNVAKVLDAGATDAGRPYFVMECVAGEPITVFADKRKLALRQRLELFTQACEAIQHAHQKAIIHRDLKPSNILVTEVDTKALVKVIDFGVAKAISHRLTERTLFTQTGQFVGTPEYMAPEQAEAMMLDVDTRADVYSLGVVLYELLSGALPFDPKSLRSGGYQEIQRIIREVDPPRPSTQLSKLGQKASTEVARLRQTPLDSLARQLRSELEWIPLKAMRKDRGQRYASAREMAEDIENYLASRPLRAGPESTVYRARKFFRRNKRTVAASGAMLLLLIAGIVTTTYQAIRATRAEQRALSEKQEAQRQRQKADVAAEDVRAVNRFLTDDLLASASPEVTRGREMTVREALDRAAAEVANTFKDRPLTEAAVRNSLASTYDQLGLSERALDHAQAALAIFRRERGADDEETIAAANGVGMLLAKLNRHGEAETLLRETYERSRRVLVDDHPTTIDCMISLATTLRMQERFAEAEPLYRQAVEADRRVHGPESLEVSKSLNNLAVLLNTQHRPAEAEPLYRESLAIKAKLVGKDHPAYLSSMGNLARVLTEEGKLPESEAMLREVLREDRRVLGDDHPSTMLMMHELAWVLSAQQKYEEAEPLLREALDRRRRALGEDDVDTLQTMANLGRVLTLRQKYDEAETLLKQALAGRRTRLGEANNYTMSSTSSLANLYERQERWADAEPLLAELCAPQRLSKLKPVEQAHILARRGRTLLRLGRDAQAEEPLRQSLDTSRLPDALADLAEICDHTNRPDEAARLRAELKKLPPATQR